MIRFAVLHQCVDQVGCVEEVDVLIDQAMDDQEPVGSETIGQQISQDRLGPFTATFTEHTIKVTLISKFSCDISFTCSAISKRPTRWEVCWQREERNRRHIRSGWLPACPCISQCNPCRSVARQPQERRRSPPANQTAIRHRSLIAMAWTRSPALTLNTSGLCARAISERYPPAMHRWCSLTFAKSPNSWSIATGFSPKTLNELRFSPIYTRFLLPLECHEWSAAPISAYLRRGPRGYFGRECCTGGESQHCAWSFPLDPPINPQHEAGQPASIVF